MVVLLLNINITSNNGCLGSRIDEDRSEFRYIMRIAGFVNHQIVERTLPFFARGGFLFECGLLLLVIMTVCGGMCLPFWWYPPKNTTPYEA